MPEEFTRIGSGISVGKFIYGESRLGEGRAAPAAFPGDKQVPEGINPGSFCTA